MPQELGSCKLQAEDGKPIIQVATKQHPSLAGFQGIV